MPWPGVHAPQLSTGWAKIQDGYSTGCSLQDADKLGWLVLTLLAGWLAGCWLLAAAFATRAPVRTMPCTHPPRSLPYRTVQAGRTAVLWRWHPNKNARIAGTVQ